MPDRRLPLTRPAVESSFPDVSISEAAYSAWETKRSRELSRSLAKLAKWRKDDIDELLLASHYVSEHIARMIPAGIPAGVEVVLPRGYTLRAMYGQLLLSLEGKLFSTVGRDLAEREQLGQLHADLLDGLVSQIRELKTGGGSDAA